MTISVLIADDHNVVRQGLRVFLGLDSELEVVNSEASNGEEALHMARQFQPDVVLMDLRMPGMDGLEAIERIRHAWPQIAVVILTTYNEDNLMLRGLRAGASGYLLKDVSREILFQTIHAAARGELLVQPQVMTRILAQAAPPAASPTSVPLSPLTERERSVLAAAARGERNKEIARRLSVTEHTIKAHLSSIYMKLEVDSRAAAVAKAIELRILPLPPFPHEL